MNALEFFVASRSTLLFTGMLAEIKTDLKRELESQKVPASMRQVTGRDQVGRVAAMRMLLDEAEGTESEAGETEVE